MASALANGGPVRCLRPCGIGVRAVWPNVDGPIRRSRAGPSKGRPYPTRASLPPGNRTLSFEVGGRVVGIDER